MTLPSQTLGTWRFGVTAPVCGPAAWPVDDDVEEGAHAAAAIATAIVSAPERRLRDLVMMRSLCLISLPAR
jgi:hypothetical protein